MKRPEADSFDLWDPNALVLARNRAGLSQVQLADVLGVSRNAIGRWEKGEVPRVDKRVNLEAFIVKYSKTNAPAIQDQEIMKAIDEAAAGIRVIQRAILALSENVEKIRDTVRAARIQ